MVKNYMETLKTVVCQFCGGWGHIPKKCPTLKSIEKTAKTSPGLNIAWGRYKSDKKLEGIDDAVEAKICGKKRQRVDAVEKMGDLDSEIDILEGT